MGAVRTEGNDVVGQTRMRTQVAPYLPRPLTLGYGTSAIGGAGCDRGADPVGPARP